MDGPLGVEWRGATGGVEHPHGLALRFAGRYPCCQLRIRRNQHRTRARRAADFALPERARAELSSRAGRCAGGAGAHSFLEPRGMNQFPWLSILTLVPIVGACLALLAGKRRGAARAIAASTALIALGITLYLWSAFNTASGAMQFGELHTWMPALG